MALERADARQARHANTGGGCGGTEACLPPDRDPEPAAVCGRTAAALSRRRRCRPAQPRCAAAWGYGASTAVIRKSMLEPLDAQLFATGKFNTLLSYPHVVAVLRQKAAPELVE